MISVNNHTDKNIYITNKKVMRFRNPFKNKLGRWKNDVTNKEKKKFILINL